MSKLLACPNHNGAYDCTPFCRICEGDQELQDGEVFSVWVGGEEVNDNYLFFRHAQKVANNYLALGYDEVAISKEGKYENA